MNKKEIQKQLASIQVKDLSTLEQEKVWDNVRRSIASSRIKKHRSSPFSVLKKSIAITLIFGMTTGVAFAADGAKPGDRLFVLDRALENFQLSIASESKKDELKVKFALERVAEVKDIFKEVSAKPTDTSIKTSPKETEEVTETPALPETKPEPYSLPPVDTETDPIDTPQHTLTISQDTPSPVETTAKEGTSIETTLSGTTTNEDVLDTNATVDQVRTILANISDGDKKRIEVALGTALSFLGDVKGELVGQGNNDAVSYIDFMLEQLNKEISTLPGEVTFEIDLSAKKEYVKFEVTSDNDTPKVQIDVMKTKPTDKEEIEEPETKKDTLPQTKKLEIKDGSLSITETTPETPEIPDTENTEGTTTPETVETKDAEDGTTTVKVIIKKLENDFEIVVPDNDQKIHDIIDGYDGTEEGTEEQKKEQ